MNVRFSEKLVFAVVTAIIIIFPFSSLSQVSEVKVLVIRALQAFRTNIMTLYKDIYRDTMYSMKESRESHVCQ